MKKLSLILLTLVIVIGITACQSNGVDKPIEKNNLEGNLDSILDKIYETADLSNSMKDFIKDGLFNTEVTEENVSYYFGKEIEFKEAIASEPMINASAYSLCLVRVKDGADIEKIKTDIKENVDPRKWICVGVEPENVIVDNIGDVVILIMSNEGADALHDAFLQLKGK